MKPTSYTPRSWLLHGLPVFPEIGGKIYIFNIWHLDFAAEREAIYLHIPEIAHRDAEGRPLFQEQSDWVNNLLVEGHIRAQHIWHSQWQFANLDETNTLSTRTRMANLDWRCKPTHRTRYTPSDNWIWYRKSPKLWELVSQ